MRRRTNRAKNGSKTSDKQTGIGSLELVTALLLLSGKLVVDGILLRRVGRFTLFVIGKYRDDFMKDVDIKKITSMLKSYDKHSLDDLFDSYKKSIKKN